MEVKPGYKQTEVGVIPEDWEIKRLEDIAAIDPENLGSSTPSDFMFNYIAIEDVDVGILRSYSEQKFGLAPSRARRRIRAGDILVSSVRPNLQSHLLFYLNGKSWVCSTGFSVVRCRDVAVPGYIFSHLFSRSITKQIESLLTGSSYPAINGKDVKALLLPMPPTLAEQSAIATALSDADALIQSLERLIAKKRDIKQGAMQELLTGKKRLPGFEKKKGYKQTEVGVIPEDWNVQILGDIFSISAGGDLIKDAYQKEYDEKYPFPIYSNALSAKGLYGYSQIYRHENNCITVTARGTIGFANMRNHKFDAIGRLLILQPILRVDCSYISEFINQRISFSIESTGVPQLTAPQIAKDKVAFPGYEEQTAIATVLSDMDAEIAALESKLAKARQIKEGMMQELLTGRIRLT